MFKKLLLVTAIGIGLIYGTGSNFATVKRSILGAADGQAKSLSGNIDNRGWGSA